MENKEEKMKITRCNKCKKRFFGAGNTCYNCKTNTPRRRINLSNTMGAINKK